MPFFGKKKNEENKTARNSSSASAVTSFSQSQTNSNGQQLTIRQVTRTTETSTSTHYQQRSVSVCLGTPNWANGASQLSLSNMPANSVSTISLPGTSSYPQLTTDARPIVPSSSSSGINLNYKSPYQHSSPVYRSFQNYPKPITPAKVAVTAPKPFVRLDRELKPTPTIRVTNNEQLKHKPVSYKNAQDPMKLTVKKTGKFCDTNADSIPTYKTRAKTRGEVLIINNVMFNDKSQRHGADVDHKTLKDLFDQLGFKVTLRKDLKKSAMEGEVKSFSKKSSLKNVDISVVIIMSHGTNHEKIGGYTEIYGVDDQGCAVDELIAHFTAENCKHMAGKPKIFMFQCCRGNNEEFIQSDAKKMIKDMGFADMLIAHSTLPGFVSHRDPSKGTWYIQTMCDVFSEHAHEHHVEDMLKIVDQRLSTYGKTRQISSYESRGFKKCYLHPMP